jgi:hypothetical protein
LPRYQLAKAIGALCAGDRLGYRTCRWCQSGPFHFGGRQPVRIGGNPPHERVHGEHAGHLLSLARRRGLQSTTHARRYEPARGISFSGESAKHHVAPMIRLMGRNLQIGVHHSAW